MEGLVRERVVEGVGEVRESECEMDRVSVCEREK